MLKACRSYEEACRTFRWRIPELYNLAFDVCDRQTLAGSDGHRTALIVEMADGSVERATFQMLRLLSNRLANVLTQRGLIAGDRVLISLPPSIEAAVAFLAVAKMGAIAVPMPASLGEDPLAWRLVDSGARAALVGEDMTRRLASVHDRAPQLDIVLVVKVSVHPDDDSDFWRALEFASDTFSPVVSAPDAPAFLFYPADAMGTPAGYVHGHRLLPGNLPAVEFALGFFPQVGDIFWTPNDWMSFEALAWGVLPAWHHGVTVLATQDTDPARQLSALGRHGVRAAWIAPDHLQRLCEIGTSGPNPSLRALATGPEPLTPSLLLRAAERFGTPANEIWGSVEIGAAAANCDPIMERLEGSPGRAVPGCTVEAVDSAGKVLPAGERGLLAAAPHTPGASLGRWTGRDSVAATMPSGWRPQGTIGQRDLDGYIWPSAPEPDPEIAVIHGLPVALAEVEQALTTHPDLISAAVVALPNGELKAFVVPAPGHGTSFELARQIQDFVARKRATHEAPRRIEFVDSIPMNADGPDRDALLNRPLRLDTPKSDERWD